MDFFVKPVHANMFNTGKNITIAKYISGTIQFTNNLNTLMTMVARR